MRVRKLRAIQWVAFTAAAKEPTAGFTKTAFPVGVVDFTSFGLGHSTRRNAADSGKVAFNFRAKASDIRFELMCTSLMCSM